MKSKTVILDDFMDKEQKIARFTQIKRVISVALVLLVCRLIKLTTPYYRLKLKLFHHV